MVDAVPSPCPSPAGRGDAALSSLTFVEHTECPSDAERASRGSLSHGERDRVRGKAIGRAAVGLLVALAVAGGAHAAPIQTVPGDGSESLPLGLEVNVAPKSPLAIVQDAIRAHNYKGAIKLVEDYLKVHPDSFDAMELYGSALALDGQLDAALVPLRRAVRKAPTLWTVHTRIGDILMTQGRRDAAKHAYLVATVMWPKANRAHQRLGVIFEEEGDIDRAIEEYEKGIAGLADEYVDVKVNLAQLLNRKHEYDKALRTLGAVLPLSSKDGLGHMVLGTTYLALGRDEEAQARFDRLRELEPNSDRTNLALGTAYTIIGDADKARQAFVDAAKRQPESPVAHIALAQLEAGFKNFGAAIEDLKTASRLDPDAIRPRKLLGDMLMQKGEPEKAIEVYRAISISPKAGPDVFEALGNAYQVTGRIDDAEHIFTAMTERFSEYERGYLRLGLLYGYKRNYKLAARTLSKGLLLAPDYLPLMRALVAADRRLGNIDGAIETQTRVVNADPYNTDEASRLAVLYDSSGYAERAELLYRRVLAKRPDDVSTLNNLALILGGRGDVKEGLALAAKAAKLVPRSPNVGDTHAWLLHLSGDNDQAFAILNAARQAAPKNPTILYHLAMVQRARGDKKAARASVEQALKLSTTFREASDAKRLLEVLN